MRFLVSIVLVFLALSGPIVAQTKSVTFTPTEADILSPERGWWVYGPGIGASGADASLARIAGDGRRVVLTLARLDDFKDRAISSGYLAELGNHFALARKNGLKVMIRFAYNFPLRDGDSRTDAPIDVVLGHIRQLGPILQDNADTLVAMQGGFIGLWGESHSSSNDLDSSENKRAIRDAIYKAVGDKVRIIWRYPDDILSWEDDTTTGFHNDCFLASNTDRGTYSGNLDIRISERAAMAKLTERTFHAGETCSGPNEAEYRNDCADILAEGAMFHLSSLNRNFYTTGFHDVWKRQGCFEEVTRKLGYRLELVGISIGARGSIALTIKNTGWAAPIQPRGIVVSAYDAGKLRNSVTLKGSASSILAGESVEFTGVMASAALSDRLCISAPDLSDRLANIPAYSIRFANADAGSQAWDATLGAFCFAVTKASDPGPADPEKLDPPPPSDPTPEKPIKPKRIKNKIKDRKVHERPD